MLPTIAMLDAAAAAIKDYALGTGNYSMNLSQAAFEPLTGEGFEECDFNGYAGKTFTSFVNGVDIDEAQRIIRSNPPVGGFRFTSGSGLTEGQAIHGFEVRDVDNDIVIGRELFSPPKSISGPSQQLVVPPPGFILPEDCLQ